MMYSDPTSNAVLALTNQREETIKELLNQRMPGWTLEEVKNRLTMSIKDNVETVYLDGAAIVYFYPLEFKQEHTPEGWKMTITRNYRVI